MNRILVGIFPTNLSTAKPLYLLLPCISLNMILNYLFIGLKKQRSEMYCQAIDAVRCGKCIARRLMQYDVETVFLGDRCSTMWEMYCQAIDAVRCGKCIARRYAVRCGKCIARRQIQNDVENVLLGDRYSTMWEMYCQAIDTVRCGFETN